jgi:hypothetical protein
MPGLVPGIDVFAATNQTTWTAGTGHDGKSLARTTVVDRAKSGHYTGLEPF